MSDRTFWHSTERQLYRELVVKTRQQRVMRDREVTLAWLTAAWARADRELPTLTDVLRAGQPQTSEEQEAVWKQAAEVFGLKVKTHNKRKARIIRMPVRETA